MINFRSRLSRPLCGAAGSSAALGMSSKTLPFMIMLAEGGQEKNKEHHSTCLKHMAYVI
jgi:hypothetical protein